MGSSGSVSITTGMAGSLENNLGTQAGSISLTVGSGATGVGGNIVVSAGASLQADAPSDDAPASGGLISLASGYGKASSSGNIVLQSANAGTLGVSGTVSLKTGTSSFGNSGAISLTTGNGVGS